MPNFANIKGLTAGERDTLNGLLRECPIDLTSKEAKMLRIRKVFDETKEIQLKWSDLPENQRELYDDKLNLAEKSKRGLDLVKLFETKGFKSSLWHHCYRLPVTQILKNQYEFAAEIEKNFKQASNFVRLVRARIKKCRNLMEG